MTDPGVLFGSIISILLALALYIWVAASLQAVFSKAGEQGWKAWVPILNTVTLLQLGGVSGWWLLILLVPVLGWIAFLIVAIIAYQRVNVAFGFGAGMTVLAFLLLPVWSSIVGWGSARWLGLEDSGTSGPVRRSEAAPLDSRLAPPPLPTYGVPPRPPAPIPAATPPAPAPAAPGSFAPAAAAAAPGAYAYATSDAVDDTAVPVPAFRSSARAAAAAAALDDDDAVDPEDRAHAPYTQTVPMSYTPPKATPEPFPAPVQSVPAAPAPVSAADPWAPPVDTEGGPALAMRATRYSPAPESDHFDTSAEVSAVAGAPTLGAPRSARESVSAQHGEPEIPDAEAAFDETILAERRRTTWMLTPPLGAPIAVTTEVLIIGRRPGFDPDFVDAQLVPISDETRTMSKTHARLELQGDEWAIIDLDSTNGVILIHEDGSEVDATPGVPERLTERFLLGDAELRLARQSDGQ